MLEEYYLERCQQVVISYWMYKKKKAKNYIN